MAEQKEGDVKPEAWIQTVEKFFLDFIGVVVPGLALLSLARYVFFTPAFEHVGLVLLPPADSFTGAMLVITSYTIGHAASHIGRFIFNEEALVPTYLDQPTVRKFIVAFPAFAPGEGTPKGAAFHHWRNLALGYVPQSDRQLVYRFMFISLFNGGVATAFLLLPLMWVASAVIAWIGFGVLAIAVLLALLAAGFWQWDIRFSRMVAAAAGICVLLLVVEKSVGVSGLMNKGVWGAVLAFMPLSVVFWQRSEEFHKRTMTVPFSMALTEHERAKAGQISTAVPEGTSRRVYLAGGLKSGWQDRVRAACPQLGYLDPSKHNIQDERGFTLWDLQGVRQCDLVFAYLEVENPGGYALALEIGFAKALSKPIVFVDAKTPKDAEGARYLRMVRAAADVVFDSIEPALEYLSAFQSGATGATAPAAAAGHAVADRTAERSS